MADLPDIPLPAGIRSRTIDGINGLRVHVLEAGFETKGRPCILLLHGFRASGSSRMVLRLPISFVIA